MKSSTQLILSEAPHLDLVDLRSRVKSAIREEQNATYALLLWLAEVDRRLAFLDWGFQSLNELLVAEGYGPGSASERVQALRLLQKTPQVSGMIEAGTLSLTAAAEVARFLRKQSKEHDLRLSDPEKTELLKSVAGRSTAQLGSIFKECILTKQPERLAEFEEKPSLIKFELRGRCKERWDRMRDLCGHDLSPEFLLSKALDAWLEQNDPVKKGERAAEREKKKIAEREKTLEKVVEQIVEKMATPATGTFLNERGSSADRDSVSSQTRSKSFEKFGQPKADQRRARSIPQKTRHQVMGRDHGRCTQCGSTHLPQLDHRRRFSQGGEHTVENLRVLCRSCNLEREVSTG